MNMRGRQKVRGKGKKYSDKQAWDLYSYMAADITSGLRQFRKENVNSFPGREPMSTLEKWNAAVDEMIWTFDQINKDYPSSPRSLHWNAWHKEHPEALELRNMFKEVVDENGVKMFEYNNSGYSMPAEVEEQEKGYRDRIDSGLHLFADFFLDLWD